jgi:hypothetical protein
MATVGIALRPFSLLADLIKDFHPIRLNCFLGLPEGGFPLNILVGEGSFRPDPSALHRGSVRMALAKD